ncbi:hypothetical protein [Streptomyces tritici]|uniref:hypothetical protein n=1 Tax=Streptomyces tritici TaxID=2054410 RepID=UPI003AF113CA
MHGTVAMMRKAAVRAGGVLALAALCACGAPAAREDGALRTGRAYAAALSARDYPAACRLLAPVSREQLVADEQDPCGPALRSLGLPAPGAADGVEVYGRQALLRMKGDTLFLSLFDDGWRITAAGCDRQGGDQPYDCLLKGSG